MAPYNKTYIFGGPHPWSSTEWTSSDDRVRSGSSISRLKPSADAYSALFKGNLNITTLGGAGFALQRTTAEVWGLSSFDGIKVSLDVDRSDEKLYTLIPKDEVLEKRPDGRERSTLSWEVDFRARDGDGSGKVFVKWADLRPTFFGIQEGGFALSVVSIAGWKGGEGEDEFENEKKDILQIETREEVDEGSVCHCCLVM
ncbi:complex I intermediate-associated protein 30-domain-containing protein [Aspergillus crustosus]